MKLTNLCLFLFTGLGVSGVRVDVGDVGVGDVGTGVDVEAVLGDEPEPEPEPVGEPMMVR